MSGRTEKSEERKRRVLSAVVRQFIKKARPVSSAQVVGELGGETSSATIRNEMARLEEEGLLSKPHTSAGRTPTEEGYRYFVRALDRKPLLPASQREYILKSLGKSTRDDDLLREGTQLLTELSRLISLVLLPGLRNDRLAHVEFIPLSEKRVMILLVLAGEQIRRKVLRHRHSLRREELHRLSVFIMGRLAGMKLREARRSIEEILTHGGDLPLQLVTARYLCGGLEDMLGEISDELSTPLMYSHGWSEAEQPEFHDAEFMRRIFRVLNQRDVISTLVSRRIDRQGVNVLIGEENPLPEMRDCSLISAPCAAAENDDGSLAVIGPLRMDYEHIIPLVEFTSQVISGKQPTSLR